MSAARSAATHASTLVWNFRSLKGHAGFLTWQWEAHDRHGRVVLESKESFEMLTKCLENAAQHGYQERRDAAA
jgi:hypothetical protein